MNSTKAPGLGSGSLNSKQIFSHSSHQAGQLAKQTQISHIPTNNPARNSQCECHSRHACFFSLRTSGCSRGDGYKCYIVENRFWFARGRPILQDTPASIRSIFMIKAASRRWEVVYSVLSLDTFYIYHSYQLMLRDRTHFDSILSILGNFCIQIMNSLNCVEVHIPYNFYLTQEDTENHAKLQTADWLLFYTLSQP